MQIPFQQLPKYADIHHRVAFIAMLVVLLMTFAFGANGLNTDVVWTDELTSLGHIGVFDAPRSPQKILATIEELSSQHMPLYFMLSALWANVAGWSQVAMRMISLLSGVLMVAWVYRFGADLANRRTGLIASLLLGSSAFVVVYLHEVRMYALFMLLAVVHSWLYWRLAHHSKSTSRWSWLGFMLTTSALFYTHIFATVLFASLGLYHLLFVSKSRRWLAIILGWGLGALLFLPYVPTVIKGFTLATNKVSTFTTAMSTPELIETFLYLTSNGLIILWIPLSLALVYALWRTRHKAVTRFLIVAIIMFFTLVLINYRFGLVPLRRSRYLLLMWLPLMILFGFALTSLPRWRIITAVFMCVWFGTGWNLYRSPTFADHIGTIDAVQFYPPMQEYVYHLADKVRPQDYVVGFTDANFVNNISKHGKSTGDYYMEAQLGIDGVFIPSYYDQEELEDDIPDKLTNHPDLLLTYHPDNLPDNFDIAMDIIQSTYTPCEIIINEPDLFVQRYVDHSLDCERDYAPIVYENGVTILDKYIDYDREANRVRVVTGWQVEDDRLLDEYNVSIQLITPDWQNVGQVDRHLYEVQTWYETELSADHLEPGDYRVMVIVYHRDTGEKVTGTDLITGETGTILPIGVITREYSTEEQNQRWHRSMADASDLDADDPIEVLYDDRDIDVFLEEMAYLERARDFEACEAQHQLAINPESLETYEASIQAVKQTFIEENFGTLPQPLEEITVDFRETVYENDEYQLDYLVFDSRLEGIHVYTYLLIPNSPPPTDGYPAVVVLHANNDQMEGAVGISNTRDRMQQAPLEYVKQGAVVLVPHMIVDIDIRAEIFNTYDILYDQPFLPPLQRLLSVVDWVGLQTELPINRIGVHGLSYGGSVALWGGIVDERIDTIGLSHSIRDYSMWLYGDSNNSSLNNNQVLIWMDMCRWDSVVLMRLAIPDTMYIESSQYDRYLISQPDDEDRYAEEPLDMSTITDMTDEVARLYDELGIGERFYARLYDGIHEIDVQNSVPWIMEQLTRP